MYCVCVVLQGEDTLTSVCDLVNPCLNVNKVSLIVGLTGSYLDMFTSKVRSDQSLTTLMAVKFLWTTHYCLMSLDREPSYCNQSL
jgi:hypothetical protein